MPGIRFHSQWKEHRVWSLSGQTAYQVQALKMPPDQAAYALAIFKCSRGVFSESLQFQGRAPPALDRRVRNKPMSKKYPLIWHHTYDTKC